MGSEEEEERKRVEVISRFDEQEQLPKRGKVQVTDEESESEKRAKRPLGAKKKKKKKMQEVLDISEEYVRYA